LSNTKNDENHAKLESDDIRVVFDKNGGDKIRRAKVTPTSGKNFDELKLSTWLQESDTALFWYYSFAILQNFFLQAKRSVPLSTRK
jgi:hypothetical protein